MSFPEKPKIISFEAKKRQRLPLLQRLLTSTKRLHETGNYGHANVYSYEDAAREAVRTNRTHPINMMNELIKQTKLKPDDLFEDPLEASDWTEYARKLCEGIMIGEAYTRLPELYQKDDAKRGQLSY